MVAPKAEVGAGELLAKGWPILSPTKTSDKPAVWSLVPKTWGRAAGWQLVEPSTMGRLAHMRPPVQGTRTPSVSQTAYTLLIMMTDTFIISFTCFIFWGAFLLSLFSLSSIPLF